MSAGITNSKIATVHVGNARRGPQIGPIAIREWSFEQQSDQAPALRGIQLPRTAGREAHLQRSCSTPSPCIAPVHHRTSIASDAPRHFIQRVTTIQQLQSSLAPIFQEICASLRSGHRCSLLGTPIIALFMHISIALNACILSRELIGLNIRGAPAPPRHRDRTLRDPVAHTLSPLPLSHFASNGSRTNEAYCNRLD